MGEDWSVIDAQGVGNSQRGLNRWVLRQGYDFGIDMIEWRRASPMLVMDILWAALCLTHPRLNSVQSRGMFPQLAIESLHDLVSVGTVVHQGFDDHSLIILRESENEASTNLMSLTKTM
jgi:hypothetical protein